jgi:membrane associated rhomboid family serine protease
MSYPGEKYRFGLGGPLTPAIKYLIFTNIAIYVLQEIINRTANGAFDNIFALYPDFLQRLMVWQIFTYMFLHGGPFHLFFDLFILWIFGSEVEGKWGSRAFLKYYIICGIGAGIVHLLAQSLLSHAGGGVVGASGAIYGVLLAFALIDPDREITFLLMLVLPVNIRAKYLVAILAGLSLFAGVFAEDRVAHFAHFGGMLVGFLYLKTDWRTSALGTWFRRQRASREVVREAKERQNKLQLRESIDNILDKINEVGYENLTNDEKALLKHASQQLSEEEEQ